jgi:hypothetical protein
MSEKNLIFIVLVVINVTGVITIGWVVAIWIAGEKLLAIKKGCFLFHLTPFFLRYGFFDFPSCIKDPKGAYQYGQ